MVEINKKIIAIGESDDIPLVKNLKRIPHVAALVSEIIAAYLMPPIESGSVDFSTDSVGRPSPAFFSFKKEC
jgi:magnesium-protoporphyrin IX monomethyl ester (oxidative) cyclase